MLLPFSGINLLVAGIVRQKFITLERQSECAVDICVILALSVARRISHTKQHPNRNYFRWHFAQKVVRSVVRLAGRGASGNYSVVNFSKKLSEGERPSQCDAKFRSSNAFPPKWLTVWW